MSPEKKKPHDCIIDGVEYSVVDISPWVEAIVGILIGMGILGLLFFISGLYGWWTWIFLY